MQVETGAVLGELERAVPGKVRTDLTSLAAYGSDASIYRRIPVAVVEPESEEDVARVVRVAAACGAAVTARGGGTSVAGNAIGSGVVLDFSRRMDRILEIDPDARTARVQPGVVLDDLRAAAAEHGLTFAPDPSTHSRCTIGGMIGNNACGAHSVVWGTTAENVVSLRMIRADGSPLTATASGSDNPELDDRLRELVAGNLAVLRTELGRFRRQVSGYGLQHLLPECGFDLAKALVGSESTCGIVTEATVRLVPVPAARALAVIGFPDVYRAAEVAPELAAAGAMTVEGMGADLLAALRSRPGKQDAGQELPGGRAWLYCEAGGEAQAEAEQRAAELARLATERIDGAESLVVTDPVRTRELWRIREGGAGIVTRLADGGEAWPGWEDSAVPPENLAAYLRDLYALLDSHGLRGVPFGHFGEGCLHLRVDFRLGTEEGLAAYRSFITEAARLVAAHGGSVSGEHGDGRARSELLRHMYSRQARDCFAEFKRIFDPHGLLNPEVLVDPAPIDAGVRPGPGHRALEVTPVHALSRDGGSFAAAVNRCVGVGSCRNLDTGSMCPSFKVTRDEVHSTRGRARVLAEMLRGESVVDGWGSGEALEALDLCLSCKACASDCPVNVDMATYKAEFLHHHYRGRVRPRAHYSMGRLPVWLRVVSAVPGLAAVSNALLALRPVSALVKRAGGIEPRRGMIRFAPRSLTRRVRRRERGGATVVLWPDTFTNHLSPEVGEAAVEVLEALGYRVVLPEGFVCCGLTWHSTGQLDGARKVLQRSLAALAPHLAAGRAVIGLEPSCTVMLRDEATELLPGDGRARRLAAQTRTFAEFVAEHDGPLPFGRLDVEAIAQVHCHQEAKGSWDPDRALLERLGVDLDVISAGCCGLAGNFGFEPGHWDVSQACAERELYPKVREAAEDTLVLADGFSCRTQIAQGTERRATHLAELLRDALPRESGSPQSGSLRSR
ncbi:FAD-binding and (Fe-S)-binding domain-containing protein [Saccharopolyspora sp. ID03-671]|uniref:FAD-binding and (Fe-S)-binding domain-containing protein n=1 Tax=Saccharopolyspora sp. ID03-671 TaxID=3073066 RepID=UPI0032473CDE